MRPQNQMNLIDPSFETQESAMGMRINRNILLALLAGMLCLPLLANGQSLSKQEVRDALRKAAEFYLTKVAVQGGYHEMYSEDLSYGHSSKMGEGPTQISATGSATPTVGLAFLEAWEATSDPYYLEAARSVARAIIKGQMCSGGWDYTTELDPTKRKNFRYRIDGQCGGQDANTRTNFTNLDNNTTQGVLRLLMRVDHALNFKEKEIHEATRYALDQLIQAQHPNGAWSQRWDKLADPKLHAIKRASYPETWPRTWPGPVYYGYYTFNDDVIVNMIDVMLEAARIYREPRYQRSAEKAGDFIILAQMPDPQPGWAQQYDEQMHPAWSRRFEPPAVTGREAVSIMKGLFLLYRETGKRKYLEPFPRALEYYKRSSWIRDGKPVMARFYELESNRPLYLSKGTLISSRISFGSSPDGYELTYENTNSISHYSLVTSAEPLERLAQDYQQLLAADKSKLKRADKLHGLTPFDEGDQPTESPTASEAKVRGIIAALDHRGAWVQSGSIGGPNRVISVKPAKEMVVLLAGKLLPLHPNESLEVYEGTSPPSQRLIHSGTFASNVKLLNEYLSTR